MSPRYYRCRFPAEYALANHTEHPLSVYLREAVIIGEVDQWLAYEFAPHSLNDTLHALAAAQHRDTGPRAIMRKQPARSPNATAS